ncbi:MAG: hypothetical protein ACI840_002615 [Ulvibacter sp.]|jgi:hypothetical protein
MIKKTILLFCVILSLNGCTRDDICPGETRTTPLLIFTFKDVLNPLVAKSATNLTIETDEDTPLVIVTNVSTDSIGIPLRTGADTVRYRFIKNSGTTDEIIDIFEFNYERLDVYVNRACGFRTTYSSLAAREDDGGIVDWILNLNILKTTVEDETEAHITILH